MSRKKITSATPTDNGKNTIHKAFVAYVKGKIDIAELYSIVMWEYKNFILCAKRIKEK